MDERELRLSISRYLTNCTFVDNCMGMVLNALEETGHKDNTLVVFFSDHGDMLGERNLAHTKYCMYENAMRTPFIVRWPGTGKPGIVSDSLVSHVDLMPTWLEASGLEIPDMMVGRSLKPLLEGKSAEDIDWPQYAFSEIYTSPANPGEPRAQWTLRGTRYKLIQRAGSSRSALYDLREDPNEFNNLIGDPALSDIREEMRLEILTGVMERTETYPVVGIARRR